MDPEVDPCRVRSRMGNCPAIAGRGAGGIRSRVVADPRGTDGGVHGSIRLGIDFVRARGGDPGDGRRSPAHCRPVVGVGGRKVSAAGVVMRALHKGSRVYKLLVENSGFEWGHR